MQSSNTRNAAHRRSSGPEEGGGRGLGERRELLRRQILVEGRRAEQAARLRRRRAPEERPVTGDGRRRCALHPACGVQRLSSSIWRPPVALGMKNLPLGMKKLKSPNESIIEGTFRRVMAGKESFGGPAATSGRREAASQPAPCRLAWRCGPTGRPAHAWQVRGGLSSCSQAGKRSLHAISIAQCEEAPAPTVMG